MATIFGGFIVEFELRDGLELKMLELEPMSNCQFFAKLQFPFVTVSTPVEQESEIEY